MQNFDHRAIETKWQEEWERLGLSHTNEDPNKEKCYVLDMFPYPSGEGLHTGHTRIYTASDVYARMKRMQGYAVLHPTGWDAFGLPAEQFAIKHQVHPRASVEKNTDRFREQMRMLGLSYDWAREIDTTDPEFYRWTQWIFLRLYEKGLAYESYEPINWCPSCKTGLANEDLEGGACERCGSAIEKKPLRQWVLRITDYAERLLADLDTLKEWPEWIKELQRNWIGKSEGAEFDFALDRGENAALPDVVTVFTTRADTLFGATYLAISAELAQKWIEAGWNAGEEVRAYVAATIVEHAAAGYGDEAEKTGVATGITARNPVNGSIIPVWIGNYVVGDYGTGAVMAVPAHDERDWDFAKKYGLPIEQVIAAPAAVDVQGVYTGKGPLVRSGEMTGMESEDARRVITERFGRPVVRFKLRDWTFSRQRYWGEPIPLVHDAEGHIYPVSDEDLPVVLPEVTSYEPTGTGESPLANIREWVEVQGFVEDGVFYSVGPHRAAPETNTVQTFFRETNTMPQWAGSSWYWVRFMDPQNKDALVSPERERYWSPVDLYVGGAEHATRHLIYGRFWYKFLHDIGVVSNTEPFTRLESVGLVLGTGGVKMSKRLGNVVNPDDIAVRFGADTLRVYEMFMGPFGQSIAWSEENLMGARRFLDRLWRLAKRVGPATEGEETERLLHQTIAKVSGDIEGFRFNTAISQLMVMLNHLETLESVPKQTFRDILLVLAPFAPHLAEELWSGMGERGSIHQAAWPEADTAKASAGPARVAIQVGGKTRAVVMVDKDASEADVLALALDHPDVAKWCPSTPQKTVYVPGRILNIIL